MNAIDDYIKAKDSLRRFNQWAALIGKEYFGGTRGRGGQFGSICSAEGKLTIYSQAYDGANNYHDLDGDFRGHLGSAMARLGEHLINDIRSQLEADMKNKAAEAAKLSDELKALEPPQTHSDAATGRPQEVL